MSQLGQNPQQPVNITLVHGTWGRGFFARDPLRVRKGGLFWFQPQSRFFSELSVRLADKNIGFEAHAFLWSGANSFYARSEAARRLAIDLNRNRQHNPTAKQFVIGHSHGGTVAMLASKDLDEANKPHLITLATPFVELGIEVPSPQLLSSTAGLIGLIAFYLTIITCCTLVPLGTALVGYPWQDVPNWAFVTLCAMTFAAFAELIGYLAIGIAVPFDSGRLKKLMHGAWGGLSNLRGLKILTIRGVDDEATLTLAAGAIGTRIVGNVYQSIALLSVVIIPLCAWYGPAHFFPQVPGLSEEQNQIFATFLPIPATTLVCFLLPGFFEAFTVGNWGSEHSSCK